MVKEDEPTAEVWAAMQTYFEEFAQQVEDGLPDTLMVRKPRTDVEEKGFVLFVAAVELYAEKITTRGKG